MLKGQIFNIQRFCTDDGDGIRTTVFLKGCPLHCPWCHNPESQDIKKVLAFSPSLCINCQQCAKVCTNSCHLFDAEDHTIQRESCIICGHCADVCPTCALEILGTEYSTEEIIKIVLRDIDFYNGKGGMTISGGEPMYQSDFSIELAASAKAKNISIYLETSGCGSSDKYSAIAPYIDRFLYDIKCKPEDYPKLIGCSFDVIENNLRIIRNHNADVTLRCPVVIDFQDQSHFLNIGLLARQYRIDKIDLLPYHSLGVEKCKRFGLKMQNVYSEVSEETIIEAKKIIESISDAEVCISGGVKK